MAGRPKTILDPQKAEIFGRFRATYETMADYFQCSEQTIRRTMQDEDSEFCKAYKTAIANTKMALSEMQLKKAMEGNVTMLIWLGKQYLGQSDKTEIDHTSKGEQIVLNITSKEDKETIERSLK